MNVLGELRAVIGAAQVLVGDDAAPYEVDWRRRFHGRALAVVRPGSTAEVAAVVKACRAHGTSIVTQGGNRSLHPDVKEPPERTPLSKIKLLPDDPAGMLPQVNDIKKKYTTLFGN